MGSPVTCCYQIYHINNCLITFHVIILKRPVSPSGMLSINRNIFNKNQQYFWSHNGELERIFESVPVPIIGPVSSMINANRMAPRIIDSVLFHNLHLLVDMSTSSILNKSAKLYTENVLNLTNQGFVFLYNDAVTKEKSLKIALNKFVKNIETLATILLFVKVNGEKRNAAGGGGSASASHINNTCNGCKYKKYKQKFTSPSMMAYYDIVHSVFCRKYPNNIEKFSFYKKLINQNDTEQMYDFAYAKIQLDYESSSLSSSLSKQKSIRLMPLDFNIMG